MSLLKSQPQPVTGVTCLCQGQFTAPLPCSPRRDKTKTGGEELVPKTPRGGDCLLKSSPQSGGPFPLTPQQEDWGVKSCSIVIAIKSLTIYFHYHR